MSDFERPPKTTLVDIYEAAGCDVSEDRQSVSFDSGKVLQPFDIVLRVVPTGLEYYGNGGQVKMTFAVPLRDDYDYGVGGQMNIFENTTDITLPVDQVRIMKKENNE